MECKELRPGFELESQYPFPTTITITPRASSCNVVTDFLPPLNLVTICLTTVSAGNGQPRVGDFLNGRVVSQLVTDRGQVNSFNLGPSETAPPFKLGGATLYGTRGYFLHLFNEKIHHFKPSRFETALERGWNSPIKWVVFFLWTHVWLFPFLWIRCYLCISFVSPVTVDQTLQNDTPPPREQEYRRLKSRLISWSSRGTDNTNSLLPSVPIR